MNESWGRVLLDGVLGDVIGALIAVLVVVLGFRFERDRDRERAIVEECRRMLRETRTIKSQHDHTQPPWRTDEERSIKLWKQVMDGDTWKDDMAALVARVLAKEPKFARILHSCAKSTHWWHLSGKVVTNAEGKDVLNRDPQEVFCAIANTTGVLQRRIDGPRWFKKLSDSEIDELVAAIKDSTEFIPKLRHQEPPTES